uniref:CRAL-TRIO domain-containing protein n=1 Tax=Timema bartmani TaxID=61472 RepID=A0A7R9HVJ5_9NEOP|nr:unnamed protein product [Timema bartmani]
MEVNWKTILEKTLKKHDRDSSLDLLVIENLVYRESGALDHAATVLVSPSLVEWSTGLPMVGRSGFESRSCEMIVTDSLFQKRVEMSRVTAEEEYRKNPKLRPEDIHYLQDWLSKQPHLPAVPENHYTIKTHAPELWGKRDPLSRDIQDALDVTYMVLLPERDRNGNLVLLFRMANYDPSKFIHEKASKAFLMLNDMALLEHGTVPGLTIVFDNKGVGFNFLPRVNISILKKIIMFLQVVVIEEHIP